MLAALLLVALIELPLSTLLLFTPAARRAPGLVSTIVAGAGTAALSGGVAAALGALPGRVAAGAALLAVGALFWLRPTRGWGALGRVAWSSAVISGALYLAYMLDWTFRSRLGPLGTAGGSLLWLLELAAYLLGLAYLWEMIDVLATAVWRRRVAAPPPAGRDDELPFVSLHVPAHNEPPEMVIETLRSLLALDYPDDRLEVIMIDDNTEDPTLWQPVADFCREHPGRLRFHHLQDWPGFKSGALNFALGACDERAEVIGVIDADYLADRDYLRRCAALFTGEPRLGFVQTPQDYREWQQASYYRRLYYSYSYFFEVSQASRNERDAAIFGGTMGLIRRRALEEVGGWDEWCVTEDAELSLRLLRAGWSGRHIDRSFGRGVMPLTFEALKRQRFRWCFGGIQILRLHWRSLLPWDRDPDNRLSTAQRLAYLSGGLQWYGDGLGFAFSAFLLVASAELALGGGVVFRRLSGFLLAAVPALALLGLLRALALLRGTTRASWRDALGAFGIWLALSWTVATASVRGAFAPAGVFLRTPKTRGAGSWTDAMRANRAEVTFAALGLAGIAVVAAEAHGPARWFLAGLLCLPVAGQLAAPINTVAALRAELPDALRRRRRSERLRAWASGPLRPRRVAGFAVLTVGITAASLVVLAPGTPPVAAPNLLQQAQGRPPELTGPGAGPHQRSPRPDAAARRGGGSSPSARARGGSGGRPGSAVPSGPPAAGATRATSGPGAAPTPTPTRTAAGGAGATPTSVPSASPNPPSGPSPAPAASRTPSARPSSIPASPPAHSSPRVVPTQTPSSRP